MTKINLSNDKNDISIREDRALESIGLIILVGLVIYFLMWISNLLGYM